MFAVPDLFALEPDGVTPRLRNTIVDLTGGWFDPANRGPRWAGWYQVARSPNPFVVNLNHGLKADVYGFQLHFWPGPNTGVHYAMPPASGQSGPTTVLWTREWLYLHYEPNMPVFRTFSADTGQWTTFDQGWVGALVFVPYPT